MKTRLPFRYSRPVSFSSWAVLAVMSLGAGCGPDFSGHWQGNLNESWTCSDGSSAPSISNPINWVISEGGGLIKIVTTGACGTFDAEQRGSEAELLPKDCPQVVNPGNGAILVQHVRTGQLSLRGETMSVTLNSAIDVYTSSARGVCQSVATGVLGH